MLLASQGVSEPVSNRKEALQAAWEAYLGCLFWGGRGGRCGGRAPGLDTSRALKKHTLSPAFQVELQMPPDSLGVADNALNVEHGAWRYAHR
jgi:hypothetical protein